MLDIRPLSESDAPRVHQLLGDPDVAMWFRPKNEAEPYSLIDCEEFVRAQIGCPRPQDSPGVITRLPGDASRRRA